MEDTRALSDALDRSLDALEPPPFRDRAREVVGRTPATPGVLTVRTARTVDPAVDIETAARRGAGVQLCYEGLDLTRSLLDDRPWEDGDRDYHRDLLVAEVLVSRGFNTLSQAGTVTDVVAIVQRFGRIQTELDRVGGRDRERPLDRDILELGVNTGADLALDGVPDPVRAHSSEIATRLLDYPLPEPERIAAVDGLLDTLASEVRSQAGR